MSVTLEPVVDSGIVFAVVKTSYNALLALVLENHLISCIKIPKLWEVWYFLGLGHQNHLEFQLCKRWLLNLNKN